MRRLACTLVGAAALAVPGSAQAHTLTIGLATARAQRYAAELAAETWPNQDAAWQVTRCARLSPHSVNCAFFTVSEPDSVVHRRFRCDATVQVYYASQRSRYRYTRAVGMPRCHPE